MRMAKCPGQHSWLPLWGNVVLGVAAAIVESLDGQLKDPAHRTPLLPGGLLGDLGEASGDDAGKLAGGQNACVDFPERPARSLYKRPAWFAVALRVDDAYRLPESLDCVLYWKHQVRVIGDNHSLVKHVVDAVYQQERCQIHIRALFLRPQNRRHQGPCARSRIYQGISRPILWMRDKMAVMYVQIRECMEGSQIILLPGRGLLVVRQRYDSKPIPRWDVHFGGLEYDLKDSTALHLTFMSQLWATDSAV